MPETTTDPYERKVLETIPRRYDLEIHVCEVTVEDRTYLDIREFIPSMQQYGRGVLIPAEHGLLVGEALIEWARNE